MLWKKIVVTAILCLIIGYFIGVHLSYDFIPVVKNEVPMSKADYYQLIIGFFEAIGTCAAVIVALFLNEIRAWFKKVTFEIKLDNDDAVEEIVDIKGVKKAIKYHNHIQFHNKGNINAQNCELFLENAQFFLENNSRCSTSLSLGSEPISWNNTNTSVYIPSQGKKVLHIFEMTAPQKQTNPDGKIDNIKPAEYVFLGLPSMEAI